MKEAIMTGAQVLQAQGRREEGRREMLLEMLRYKFGELSEDVETKVQALTIPETDTMSKRILTAATLAEMGL
jgi:hypothetical protein